MRSNKSREVGSKVGRHPIDSNLGKVTSRASSKSETQLINIVIVTVVICRFVSTCIFVQATVPNATRGNKIQQINTTKITVWYPSQHNCMAAGPSKTA